MDHHETVSLGGKGQNLDRMTRMGLPVPPWFAVPAPIMARMTAPLHLAELFDSPEPNWAEVSKIAASKIRSLDWPAELETDLRTLYQQAFGKESEESEESGEAKKVAVRSSALGEDGTDHSFAGQFDTFLSVRGVEAVLEAIKGCWASAYSERALSYRHSKGLPLADIKMAVIVQQMIEGEVSGVLFTADPLSGARDKLVISSTWGLGEGLVSGELDADTFVVCRRSGTIDPTVVDKREMIVPALEGGTKTVPVPPERTHRESLTVEQIRTLTDLAESVEAKFGTPQDIEWTIADGNVFLLQARPITALPPAQPTGKKNLFDNSNIVESYSGVTTPLTFSFASRGYEILYRRLAESLGAHRDDIRQADPLFRNMIALIQGRVYYNLGNWYSLLTYLPGYQHLKSFFAQSIGAREDEGGTDAKQRRTILRLLGCNLRNYLAWDRDIADFQRRFRVSYEHARLLDVASMRLDALARAYVEFFEGSMLPLWKAPLINEFFTMLFYGLLKRLMEVWGLDKEGASQNDLLCGEGGIESTEPTKAIARLSLEARKNPALVTLLEDPTVLADWENRLADYPVFLAGIHDYLNRYGFRCMGELRLESIPVADDPTFLFAMIQNYLDISEADLLGNEEKEQRIRKKAEKTVFQKLQGHPLRRVLFGWVLKNARRGIKNRENMRFARTKVFGVVRILFLAMGKELHRRGLLENPRDILYLTVDEILGWIDGRAVTTGLKSLATLRTAEFARFEKEAPDDRFETFGPVHLDNLFQAPQSPLEESSNTLKGTSCCPGVVRNKARVLRPGDDLRLSGEILVAERTDPGWVPLYPSISGLLIERGSVLSHSAIVAREMGLPTIVGIKELTKRVADGQFLEMDARAGLVHLDRRP